MSEIDQQFIEYVVKSLVGKPDAVHVDRRIDEKGVLLELTVDPEDLGRVIGKRGATAQSLRTLLRALGTKNDARYNLKIIDNGVGAPAKDDSVADEPAPAPAAEEAPAEPKPAEETPAEETPSEEEPAEAEEAPAEEPSEPEAPAETPTEEPAEAAGTDEEDAASDRLAKSRAELADLDDLDI